MHVVRTPCSVAECERPVVGRSLCGLHYQRAARGNPLAGPSRNGSRGASLRDRLEARIDRDNAEGHWLWTGYRMPNGYGKFTVAGSGKCWLAHRLAWELLRGPIPDGMTLDHLCRVRHCVNPDHLEPVLFAVNVQRGVPFRVAAPRELATHCRHGHEYTPENTYLPPASSPYKANRQCRACRQAIQDARVRP